MGPLAAAEHPLVRRKSCGLLVVRGREELHTRRSLDFGVGRLRSLIGGCWRADEGRDYSATQACHRVTTDGQDPDRRTATCIRTSLRSSLTSPACSTQGAEAARLCRSVYTARRWSTFGQVSRIANRGVHGNGTLSPSVFQVQRALRPQSSIGYQTAVSSTMQSPSPSTGLSSLPGAKGP